MKLNLSDYIGLFVGITMSILLLFFVASIDRNCCSCATTTGNIIEDMKCCAPCPNPEIVDEVREYNNLTGFGCSGCYYEYCERWKEDNNRTEECFR